MNYKLKIIMITYRKVKNNKRLRTVVIKVMMKTRYRWIL